MVNIYKQELTILQQEILRVLFAKVGKSLNQRQIAKILEVSQAGIIKALPKLKEKDYVRVNQDEESKRWAIELNTDNPKVIQLKRGDNLKKIYESGLVDHLQKEFPGGTIILFGSYSRGEDTIDSDIDIAIIGRKEKDIGFGFNKRLEKEININFYPSFKEIHKHLKDNILNGIILSGSVEL